MVWRCWRRMFCAKSLQVVRYSHSVAGVVTGSNFCSGTVRGFASIIRFSKADVSPGPVQVMAPYA